MYCPECGGQYEPGAKFCAACGSPLPTAAQPANGQYGQAAQQQTYQQNNAQPVYGQYGQQTYQQNNAQPVYGQYGQQNQQQAYQPDVQPKKTKKEKQPKQPGKSGKKAGLIIAIILAVLLVLGAGAGALYVFVLKAPEPPERSQLKADALAALGEALEDEDYSWDEDGGKLSSFKISEEHQERKEYSVTCTADFEYEYDEEKSDTEYQSGISGSAEFNLTYEYQDQEWQLKDADADLNITEQWSTAAAEQESPVAEAPETATGTAAGFSGGEVAVCWYTFNDTYLSSVRTAMDAAFNAAGITYTDYDANGSQTTQTDAVTTAIAKGASMLIVNLVDSSSTNAAQAIADKANAAGIPVIFFNRSIAADDEGAEAIIRSVTAGAAYVGTDYTMAGMTQGDMIGDYLVENYDAVDTNGDGVISYTMFKGDEANVEAIARTEYAIDNANAKLTAAGKSVMNGSTETDPNGAWSYQFAYDQMLECTSEPELIIANNDEMACGAIDGLKDAGYDAAIPVFGIDATDEGKDTLTGTVSRNPEGMANTIVTIVQNLAAGKDKFDSIDSENIVGTWRVNIPYEAYIGE